MNTDQETGGRFAGLHAGVTDVVIRVSYEVYNELGGGFLEKVYHPALAMALRQAGLQVESEVPGPVYFRQVRIADFNADLIVEGKVILELKAVSAFDRAHEAQLLNYLRATKYEVGLLLNFGSKPHFKRFVLKSANKQIRVDPRSSAVE